jgi:DnaJ-class molecular chaperone
LSKLLEVRFNKLKKEIRRTPCVGCEGTGSIPEKRTITCPKCSGKGWHGGANLEIVCENCNGAGEAQETAECQCDKCSGRGHFISIIEIKKRRIHCVKCPTEGQLEECTCEICDGSGYDPLIQTCSRCRGSGNLEGWQCSYCTATGTVPVIGEEGLPQSNYINEKPCEPCEGIGSIWQAATCDTCKGKGYTLETFEKDVTPNLG